MADFILASASVRRKQLLRQMGLSFKVIPSQLKERRYRNLSPAQLVKRLAFQKAEEVAKRVGKGIVIGADTVVVSKGEILGKPRNPRHAEKILRKLSGSTHFVYTGVAMIDAGRGTKIVDYEKTRVKMRKLSGSEIVFHSKRHLDKAGAYAIQERKDAFIEKIEGCYYNVVGLPIAKLKQMIERIKEKAEN